MGYYDAVDRFSELMKVKLDENVHKGGWTYWEDDPVNPEIAITRILKHLGRLSEAFDWTNSDELNENEAAERFVSIANYAMMAVDSIKEERLSDGNSKIQRGVSDPDSPDEEFVEEEENTYAAMDPNS